MNEELVEVGDTSHPAGSEEARRWPKPDLGNQRAKGLLFESDPLAFSEAAPRARNDETRCCEEAMFAKNQMRREVMGCPRTQQSRCKRAQVFQQVAELLTLDGVEEDLGHRVRLPYQPAVQEGEICLDA